MEHPTWLTRKPAVIYIIIALVFVLLAWATWLFYSYKIREIELHPRHRISNMSPLHDGCGQNAGYTVYEVTLPASLPKPNEYYEKINAIDLFLF